MMKKISTLLLLAIFCMVATAGEKVLVRNLPNGQQEIIPLKKGELAQDAISRLENSKASLLTKSTNAAGLIDTLKHYAGNADGEASFAANSFVFYHQDAAFIWFVPAAGGRVKEFWWRNSTSQGEAKKATIRAWYANPKVATRPAATLTKYLGAYKDPTDGDGLVTPFKPEAGGDQWFYGNGAADSASWNFDPLGTEVSTWVPGGYQFTLDSAKWQGIKLEDYGDSMFVNLGQIFGFTFMNDTKLAEIASPELGVTIRYAANSNPAPHHSFKFYENGRTGATDKGWHLRGDNDWGMYAVIEYTTDRAPSVTRNTYSTTLKTAARAISAVITDDNPGGGTFGVASARLFTKIGSLAKYDSVSMTASGTTYSANAPAAAAGDTIFWYIAATDVNGNRTQISAASYKIFKKTQPRLFIYNNALFSLANANYYYNSKSTLYDRWSAPTDGTGELADLLALYGSVALVDGSFPARNVYPAIAAWLKTGAAGNEKNLFFTSQDYGCYITDACQDTAFAATAWEKVYLGITTLGPQDQGSTNRPVKVVPQVDPITNYIIKYNTDSSVTMWHYPTFELGFAAYPDFMVLEPSAKALLKDAAGTNVYGAFNKGTGFNTMFMALDAGSLEFRSDTSLHNAAYTSVTDPKYNWLPDVASLSNSFFAAVTDVNPATEAVPGQFSLGQNYPNPFNPTTEIEFTIPVRSNVAISVYNIVGQKIATIVNDVREAGAHRATWNGKDLTGKTVASGIYFYQMQAGSFEDVKKMILMK